MHREDTASQGMTASNVRGPLALVVILSPRHANQAYDNADWQQETKKSTYFSSFQWLTL